MIRRNPALSRWPLAFACTLLVSAAEAKPKPGGPPVDRKASRQQAQVSAMLSRGILALTTRDFATAYREFAQAYRLSPSAELLYQLGIVVSAEGKTVEAQDLLRRYLAESEATDATAPKRAEAERILALPHGPTGNIRVSGPAGSEVLLDDRLVGKLPLSRPLSAQAGAHQLSLVDKADKKSVALTLRSGGTSSVTSDAANALTASDLPTVMVLAAAGATSALPLSGIEAAMAAEKLAPFDAAGAGFETPAADCWDDHSCLLRIPDKSALDLFLHAEATTTANGAHLKLTLFDVPGSAEVGTREADCAPCTAESAQQLSGELLHQLVTSERRQARGQLAVRSTPESAEVQLAGWRLGHAPIDRQVLAGDYELTVKTQGHVAERRRITITANQQNAIAVALRALPAVPATPPPKEYRRVQQKRPIWRLAVGSVVAAGGVALIGRGGWALSLNGSCVDAAMPPALACPSLYTTTGVGAGLVGGGAALAIGGALLLALPGPKKLVEVERAQTPQRSKLAERTP